MKKEFTLRLDDAACAELENLKKLSGEKTDAKAIRFAIQNYATLNDRYIETQRQISYNCEGLVCADGVITPRTKMHRKVLWYKRMNQKSLTALQWAKEGYVVNPDAIGRKWKNNPHNSKAIIYYVSDEVHEDKEAAKEFLKSRRKEKKE